jgi:hypothetical protein
MPWRTAASKRSSDLFAEAPLDFDRAMANATVLDVALGVHATFVSLQDLSPAMGKTELVGGTAEQLRQSQTKQLSTPRLS